MAIIQTHPKMLDELLSAINKSENVGIALKSSLNIPYLKEYLIMAVSDQWTTIDIPNVDTIKYNYHRSMAGAFLLNRQTHNIISNVIMIKSVNENTKLKQFKALSEMLFVDESKILNAILTKNLSELYPNITFDILYDALSVSLHRVD